MKVMISKIKKAGGAPRFEKGQGNDGMWLEAGMLQNPLFRAVGC